MARAWASCSANGRRAPGGAGRGHRAPPRPRRDDLAGRGLHTAAGRRRKMVPWLLDDACVSSDMAGHIGAAQAVQLPCTSVRCCGMLGRASGPDCRRCGRSGRGPETPPPDAAGSRRRCRRGRCTAGGFPAQSPVRAGASSPSSGNRCRPSPSRRCRRSCTACPETRPTPQMSAGAVDVALPYMPLRGQLRRFRGRATPDRADVRRDLRGSSFPRDTWRLRDCPRRPAPPRPHRHCALAQAASAALCAKRASASGLSRSSLVVRVGAVILRSSRAAHRQSS